MRLRYIKYTDQWCRSGKLILDPDYLPYRILDLGSRIPKSNPTRTKRGVRNFLFYFFVAISFTKLNIMDSDPAKWCRSDRIRIQDTGPNIQYIFFYIWIWKNLGIFQLLHAVPLFQYQRNIRTFPLISGSSWGAKKVFISSSALRWPMSSTIHIYSAPTKRATVESNTNVRF